MSYIAKWLKDDPENLKRIGDTLIRKIEYLGLRPQLYVGSDDPALVDAYISGYINACHIFGLYANEDTYETILVERGWKFLGPYSLLSQLREQGLTTNAELNKEIVAIHIEVLKRILHTT